MLSLYRMLETLLNVAANIAAKYFISHNWKHFSFKEREEEFEKSLADGGEPVVGIFIFSDLMSTLT